MAQQTAECTILFADLAGSTALYEKMGDAAAQQLIKGVLGRLAHSAMGNQGQVIKTIGDEVMCAFDSPTHAAQAALEMQRAGRPPITIRIGFHHGSVIRQSGDVFGDCVNIAARLTSAARGGQILSSEQTLPKVTPALRQMFRPFDEDKFKGKEQALKVIELVWEDAEAITQLGARTGNYNVGEGVDRRLILTAGQTRAQISSDLNGSYSLGRDATCHLRVDAPLASRVHAKLDYRRGKFVLSDHSTNGTYVVDYLGREVFIRRESMPLTGKGVLSLGCPLSEQSGDIVRFNTE